MAKQSVKCQIMVIAPNKSEYVLLIHIKSDLN